MLAAGVPDVGVGYLGVAFAFGLTVLTMAYAVGHISGGHFNPAISLGLALAKRFKMADLLPYIVTQVVAAIVAAAALFVVANGVDGFSAKDSGFATNGYGDRSPRLLPAGGDRDRGRPHRGLPLRDPRRDGHPGPKGFAPIAIGLSLTLIHLVSIPVSNTSVNPARSTGPALFAGADAIGQLWVFWLAPLVGGAIAGLTYVFMFGKDTDVAPLEVATEA